MHFSAIILRIFVILLSNMMLSLSVASTVFPRPPPRIRYYQLFSKKIHLCGVKVISINIFVHICVLAYLYPKTDSKSS